MATDPFAAPLLKLYRAKEHIRDLDREISAYLMLSPFQLVIAQYPEIAQKQLRIETNPPIPSEFALTIGDAIHNLRAALDILIFGLIGSLADHPRNIQFPFCKDADSLESAIAVRQIQLAGERVVSAIRSLEPYPDGKHDLHAIHDMDIRDKHKLLMPVGRNAAMSEDDLREIEPRLLPAERKGVAFVFTGGGEDPIAMKINIEGVESSELERIYEPAKVQPAFSICFGQGEPFAFRPVVPVLTHLAAKTAHAITVIRGAVEGATEHEDGTPK